MTNEKRKYKLSIDPTMLKVLGPNMYKNIYFILGELIANAWDADAENVYIFIENDKVIVEDDGNGMSYKDEEVAKYLVVGKETRSDNSQSITKKFKRKKMGRKGLGKLSALSISENVEILTIKNGEKSGFVLSVKQMEKNGLLPEIPLNQIKFRKIINNGTSIIMKNPKHLIHKTISVINKNITRIFPFSDNQFKIHIIKDDDYSVVSSSKETIPEQLSTVMIFGEEFEEYGKKITDKSLVKIKEPISKIIEITNNKNEKVQKILEIRGWIGTYLSTSNRKKDILDFQDNFISLYANKKIGEFNILDKIGKNTVTESYIVGELHVDLFEDSDLPDMALSNREGYISDDSRYEIVLQEARKMLNEIISLRNDSVFKKKEKQKIKKIDFWKAKEQELIKKTIEYKSSINKNIQNYLKEKDIDEKFISGLVEKANEAINDNLPLIGIKSTIDVSKKKLLISHTKADIIFADVIFKMLEFNNLPPEEMIYSNAEDQKARIPYLNDIGVLEYLRDFFVNSLSTQKINVLFITSSKMSKSWFAVSEVGASWITKAQHMIFNIINDNYEPKAPLEANKVWIDVEVDYEADKIKIWKVNADELCNRIEIIVRSCGYNPKTREANLKKLEQLIDFEIKPLQWVEKPIQETS